MNDFRTEHGISEYQISHTIISTSFRGNVVMAKEQDLNTDRASTGRDADLDPLCNFEVPKTFCFPNTNTTRRIICRSLSFDSVASSNNGNIRATNIPCKSPILLFIVEFEPKVCDSN